MLTGTSALRLALFFSLLVLLPLAPRKAPAALLRVPSEHPTVQAAVDASAPDDTVLLAPGIYTDRISVATHGLTLAGQYLLNGDTTLIPATVLNGSALPDSELLYVNLSPADTFRLVGLTGTAAQTLVLGYIQSSGTLVDHCRFVDNEAGGIFIVGSGSIVRHCLFEGNKGEALRFHGANLTLSHSRLLDNGHVTPADTVIGGGARINGHDILIEGNVFRGNWSTMLPAAFSVFGYDIVATGNIVEDNHSLLHPAGLFWGRSDKDSLQGDYVHVRQNIVRNNVAEDMVNHEPGALGGFAIRSYYEERLVEDNLFENNRALGMAVADIDGECAFLRNVFLDNRAAGATACRLWPFDNPDLDLVVFKYNRFLDNDDIGGENSSEATSLFYSPGGVETMLDSNDFIGNSPRALADSSVSLELNYFGDPSGPYHEVLNDTAWGDTVSIPGTIESWSSVPLAGWSGPNLRLRSIVLDFRRVQGGEVVVDTVLLRNGGTVPLAISAIIPLSSQLTVEPGGTLVIPANGGMEELVVQYAAADADSFASEVVIQSNDGTDPFTRLKVYANYVPPDAVEQEDVEALPARPSLSRAWPNPFNGSSRIAVTLPAEARVELVLYDLMGREVGVVVQGRYGPGRHTLPLELADLPSGVYFLRLRSDGVVSATERLVLLK